jgi:hypothetical protein
MQDMIALGETWFRSQRREHLATEVSYQPAIGTTRTVRATVVVGRWESRDAAGQMLRTETQDFFVDTTDLAQDPKKGDRIVAGGVTYEVMVPPGAEHHWRWSDRNKTLRRIHTMVTQGSASRIPQTVPGAPTITLALAGESVQWTTPSDGSSPLTEYKLYVDDILFEFEPWATVSANYVSEGEVVKVSAVNAVGEGPKSAPVTVGLA